MFFGSGTDSMSFYVVVVVVVVPVGDALERRKIGSG